MIRNPLFIEPTPPEVFFCNVQVRAARMHEDPEPEELCENEVAHDGDLCPRHEPYDDEDRWTE